MRFAKNILCSVREVNLSDYIKFFLKLVIYINLQIIEKLFNFYAIFFFKLIVHWRYYNLSNSN